MAFWQTSLLKKCHQSSIPHLDTLFTSQSIYAWPITFVSYGNCDVLVLLLIRLFHIPHIQSLPNIYK